MFGIILAAGYASRMKKNKMCLIYQGKPLIFHAIETMHKFCTNIIVVTGYYHDELSKCLGKFDFVKIVYNKNYHDGMYSSIKVGVSATKGNFFLLPGDYPNIQSLTYSKILKQSGKIKVPSFNHKLGHPIYFDKMYIKEILNLEYDNLKEFRNAHDFEIVEVNDPGILQDIDTFDDYKLLTGKE